jgi:hypothetical protein
MQKHFTLCLLLLVGASGLFAQSGLKMFDDSYVHEIRIYFDEPDFWQILSDNYSVSVDTTIENVPLPGRVVIDGTELDSVGVTQKGYFSNWGAGGSLKKPLKLDFNDFIEDAEYDDLKSLNLQNAFMDPSILRDVLSYKILRDFGVPAPRTAHARIYINDDYWGLYVVVESVNKTFLKEHYGNNDGNLYKAGFTSLQYFGQSQDAYYKDFELKTNETENDWSGLVQFLKLVNTTPDATFRDSLTKRLDLESYMKSMAVDVTINNWDGHFDHGRNFYLYDNPEDGKIHWIPWDYNLAFANPDWYSYDIALAVLRSNPGYDKILPKRVLENDALKEQYLEYACELHHDVFTLEKLVPFIQAKRDLIVDDLAADPNRFYDNMDIFEASIGQGTEVMVIDSFHFMDSLWNGTSWEFVDTVFVWEYLEVVTGLESLISVRNTALTEEITNAYGISCATPTTAPPALSFETWPNPATDWLTVKLPQPGLLTFYDVNGRVQKRAAIDTTHQIQIPLQEFKNGVYWLEFVSNDARTVEKVIVQR